MKPNSTTLALMSMLHLQQIADEFEEKLSTTPLFRGIDKSDLASLLSCLDAEVEDCTSGRTVLEEGQSTRQIGLLLSGALNVQHLDWWGRRSLVSMIQPVDLFAEAYALTPNALLMNDVVALEDSRILFLDAAKLTGQCQKLCACHSLLIHNLMEVLAHKNRLLVQKVHHLTRRSTKEKVLSFLSSQALVHGGPEFDIPFDRQELADYLSVERSALSATISSMCTEGLIVYHKNHFRLLKQDES